MALAKLNVYLESGKQRIFACARDWPGSCRSGRDETAALQALIDSVPRYAQILAHTGLVFQPPTGVAALTVIERVEGTQRKHARLVTKQFYSARSQPFMPLLD